MSEIVNAGDYSVHGPCPPMGDETRRDLIEKLHAICDWRKIEVEDVKTSFKVPVREFLQHVDPKDLSRISWILSSIAALLSGHYGRADRATIDRIDPGILSDAVHEFENQVARCFMTDVGHSGVNLLRREGVKKRRRGPSVDGVGISHAKAHGKPRKAVKRRGKLGGSVIDRVHRSPPSNKRGR